jgi:hypothetical protein
VEEELTWFAERWHITPFSRSRCPDTYSRRRAEKPQPKSRNSQTANVLGSTLALLRGARSGFR